MFVHNFRTDMYDNQCLLLLFAKRVKHIINTLISNIDITKNKEEFHKSVVMNLILAE